MSINYNFGNDFKANTTLVLNNVQIYV